MLTKTFTIGNKYHGKLWKNEAGIVVEFIKNNVPNVVLSLANLTPYKLSIHGKLGIIIRCMSEEEFFKNWTYGNKRDIRFWKLVLMDDELFFVHQRFLKKI